MPTEQLIPGPNWDQDLTGDERLKIVKQGLPLSEFQTQLVIMLGQDPTTPPYNKLGYCVPATPEIALQELEEKKQALDNWKHEHQRESQPLDLVQEAYMLSLVESISLRDNALRQLGLLE